jgi:hypothetical protein
MGIAGLARLETCAALSTATGHCLILSVIGKAGLRMHYHRGLPLLRLTQRNTDAHG